MTPGLQAWRFALALHGLATVVRPAGSGLLYLAMKLLVLAFALLTACSSGTGVFINGQELSTSDKAQLDALAGGSVPAGRYLIDANGNVSYESTRSAEPFEMHGGDSHIVTEGSCTILSTPSGSLSTGC